MLVIFVVILPLFSFDERWFLWASVSLSVLTGDSRIHIPEKNHHNGRDEPRPPSSGYVSYLAVSTEMVAVSVFTAAILTTGGGGKITAVGTSTFPFSSLAVLAETVGVPLRYQLPEGTQWLDHYRELGMPACFVWRCELTGNGRIEPTEENHETIEKTEYRPFPPSYASRLAVATEIEVDRCLPPRYSLPEGGVGSLPSLSPLWLC